MTVAERLSALPPARRQMIALAILSGALAIAWYVGLKPLHRLLTSQTVWREEVRQDLAEERGKAAIESQVSGQLQSLKGAPLWRSFYAGSTEEQANAEIQEDLRALSAASGVSAVALTPLPTKEYSEYIAHGAHLNAAMTAEQLKRFSVALRAASHFLRVERFAASAPQTQLRDQNAQLNVAMDIYGYSRTAVAEKAAGQPPARGSS
jgi:hypothetical protein